MFDLGWMELLVIGVTALIVVGPKDLPVLFRKVGQFVGKARGMARDFKRAMDQAADETGLKDATKPLSSLKDPLGLNTQASEAHAKAAEKWKETSKELDAIRERNKSKPLGDDPDPGQVDTESAKPAKKPKTESTAKAKEPEAAKPKAEKPKAKKTKAEKPKPATPKAEKPAETKDQEAT